MRFSIYALIILFIVAASCNSGDDADPVKPDPEPDPVKSCVPTSLWLHSGDSISYQYDADLRLVSLTYNQGSNYVSAKTELTYDVGGRLITVVEKVKGGIDLVVRKTYNIEYTNDGLPLKLIEFFESSPETKYTTVFTHDNHNRLIKGVQTFKFAGSPTTIHNGGYIYEYNDKNNVTTVKYLVTNEAKEVIARKNLAFDDHPVFYARSKDLTLLNVYVYKHIPNVNNVLTSVVTYISYSASFSEPVTLNFDNTYGANGNITSTDTDDSSAYPQFGGLLFYKATYDCK